MMKQVLVPSLQASEKVLLRRRRELPKSGNLLVKVGETVKADDVVAETYLTGDLYIFRIAEQLGIESSEVVKDLKFKVGDEVKKGDLIAEHRGLFGFFNSRYYASQSGVVEFISNKTGHLGVRGEAKKIELLAYISGKVVECEGNNAVTIETEAAYVQGIFGVGGERRGALKVLDIAPDKIITEDDIPENIKGTVLFGGTKPSISAINKVALLGAKGMIVGSIDDGTLKDFLGYDLGIALTGDEQVPLTLVVTEGFGYMPISKRIIDLLTKFNNHFVSINGATQVRAGAIRPEIIVENHSDLPFEQASSLSLELGAKIRIIRAPYFGQLATVCELPLEMASLETGSKARVLKAMLSNGTTVIVPRANVELV